MTDDIFVNGKELLKIMNMSDEEINDLSVKDFQRLLDKSLKTEMTYMYSTIGSSVFSKTEEDSLSGLSVLSGIASAESWIKKNCLGVLGGAVVGAAIVNVVPGVLPLVGLGWLVRNCLKRNNSLKLCLE